MDAAALTALVMGIINNPLAPIVSTAVVTKMSEDIYDKTKEQTKHLLEAIRNRFAQEPDGGKASKALQNFVEEPRDYSIVLENKLFNLLQTDLAFAKELDTIIQVGPRQLLTVEEEAWATKIRMNNSLGRGTQKIKGSKKSTIKDVEMNMKQG